jgi:adenylate kinase
VKILFLGAPGSGKGTQSAVISKHFKIPTISTGDIIRNEIKNGSSVGLEMKSYINEGKLVPDAIIIKLLENRLKEGDCKNGYILDGFPRTVAQAEMLDQKGIEFDFIFDIDIKNETILKRMSGRRICEKCLKIYNIHSEMKPKVDGICDEVTCKSILIQRSDDNEETVKKRLEVYQKETLPLQEYYNEKRTIIKCDNKLLKEITQKIIIYINKKYVNIKESN